jgi:hypothetical protein
MTVLVSKRLALGGSILQHLIGMYFHCSLWCSSDALIPITPYLPHLAGRLTVKLFIIADWSLLDS